MVCLRVEGGWCALELREDGVPYSRGRMVCLRIEGGWCVLE